MITNFNFPARFKDAHLSRLEFPEEIINKIFHWVKNPKNFLIFLGNAGIGKTYTCYAIANYFIENKKYFRLMNERDFFGHLKETFKKSWEPTSEIKRICETEFFMLNDLGSGRPDDITDWQKEQIFNFIDERYESALPTIITSNHFINDLKGIYHERIVDRLCDKENVLIELNMVSKRL